MHIRRMSVGDVSRVAAIERACLSPWNETQIAEEIDRKAGCALVSVSSEGVLQGWCCGGLGFSDAELLKIAVHSSLRRQGVATMLLENLLCLLAQRGGEQIFLEVRAQNFSARRFYLKQGFEEIGKREKYYKNPVDDAVICVRGLNVDNN